MYQWRCFLFFLILLSYGSSRGQTIESLQFEIDNLREQIILVIQDNNESLVQVDSELMIAKARIQELVTESNYLKARNRELMAPEGKNRKTSELQAEIEELKQQLYSNRQVSQRNAQQAMLQIQEKEKENHRLIRRNDSLLAVATRADQRILQLEIENQSLWDQVAGEGRKSSASNNLLPSKLGSSSQVSEEVLFLTTQLEEARKMVEEASAEREQALMEKEQILGLLDSLDRVSQLQFRQEQQKALQEKNRLQSKVDSLTMVAQTKASPWPQQAPLAYTRKIDSLQHENKVLRESLNLTQRNQGVEDSRLKAVEQREQEIHDAETRLEIREHLVKNRENDIVIRQHELDIKEQKYLGLEEKEKRLKLIEQRLNELLNTQSRGSN